MNKLIYLSKLQKFNIVKSLTALKILTVFSSQLLLYLERNYFKNILDTSFFYQQLSKFYCNQWN